MDDETREYIEQASEVCIQQLEDILSRSPFTEAAPNAIFPILRGSDFENLVSRDEVAEMAGVPLDGGLPISAWVALVRRVLDLSADRLAAKKEEEWNRDVLGIEPEDTEG